MALVGFPGIGLELDPPLLVPALAGAGPADYICAVGQTGPPPQDLSGC